MSIFSEFKISREGQERIDRYLSLPVWGMMFATEPVPFGADGPKYRISRKKCREIGMTPRQITDCVRDGSLELLAEK